MIISLVLESSYGINNSNYPHPWNKILYTRAKQTKFEMDSFEGKAIQTFMRRPLFALRHVICTLGNKDKESQHKVQNQT